jgi:hypothetical protein
MTYYENPNRGPIKGHFRRRKLTARFEVEYHEYEWHGGPRTRGGSRGSADFAGWTSPESQQPWGECGDVEEIEEEDPSPENTLDHALASQELCIEEWPLPGTETRIRIGAPAEGLGELEPSGTTRAHVVARELQMLHELFGNLCRPKGESVMLEAIDLPPEDQ